MRYYQILLTCWQKIFNKCYYNNDYIKVHRAVSHMLMCWVLNILCSFEGMSFIEGKWFYTEK